jgi:hypothetical protein
MFEVVLGDVVWTAQELDCGYVTRQEAQEDQDAA